MGIGRAANTHVMYNTREHEHLDSLVFWATGEFPSAGLNLVGCADGRWFVEVDHGEDFNHIDGASRPNVTPYTEPTFYGDEEAARKFAYQCIKTTYPALSDRDLDEYYED